MKQRLLSGFLIAFSVFLIDQLTKVWALKALIAGPWRPLPVLDFALAFNTGISFGLLSQSAEVGRWALIVGTGLVTMGFCIWMVRNPSFWQRGAISLILGGAVGNLYDRLTHGFVVDFIDIHWVDSVWPYHWPGYAFNVADAAITCGAGLLMLDLLVHRKEKKDA